MSPVFIGRSRAPGETQPRAETTAGLSGWGQFAPYRHEVVDREASDEHAHDADPHLGGRIEAEGLKQGVRDGEQEEREAQRVDRESKEALGGTGHRGRVNAPAARVRLRGVDAPHLPAPAETVPRAPQGRITVDRDGRLQAAGLCRNGVDSLPPP